jgi:hypothetical protein
MKDFADIDNSVGDFPNVTSIDCTGPGETDGTAVIADTMTDQFGWVQALLSEVGDTPSGSAETATVSQILNAIKLLPNISVIPTDYGVWNSTDWAYLAASNIPFQINSNANNGRIFYSVPLPAVPMDLTIDIEVSPGASRAPGNRMSAKLMKHATGGGVPTTEISAVEDAGGTSIQFITLNSSFTPVADAKYYLEIKAGNDGAANKDSLYTVRITKDAQ